MAKQKRSKVSKTKLPKSAIPAAQPAAPMGVPEDNYQAQDAAQQLMRSQKIKADPKLHASAKIELQKMAAHAKRAAR